MRLGSSSRQAFILRLASVSSVVQFWPGGGTYCRSSSQIGQAAGGFSLGAYCVPQVLQMKEKNPDVVIFISYTSDAILYAKTMKELSWKPGIMIADNAGFNDPAFVKAYGHNGYFTSLKAIVHFYNTRDVLPRCQPHDVNEGTTCWPAPESTDNMNTSKVGNLGLSDTEEDALVAFMQTLTDGFMPRDRK